MESIVPIFSSISSCCSSSWWILALSMSLYSFIYLLQLPILGCIQLIVGVYHLPCCAQFSFQSPARHVLIFISSNHEASLASVGSPIVLFVISLSEIFRLVLHLSSERYRFEKLLLMFGISKDQVTLHYSTYVIILSTILK